MVTTKVHYHSDCPFFAGCENMLAVLLNSDELRASYNISFSFRFSAEYFDGYRSRVNDDVPLYPLNFTDFSDMIKLPVWFPQGVRRFLMVLNKIITTWPLMAYQIYIFTRLFNKIKPDILHINNGGYPGALSARAAVIAGRVAGVPKVVMVVNNLAVDYKNFLRLPDYLVDRKIANLVDLFITGSEVAAKRLQSVLKLHDYKIRSLHNCAANRLGDEKSNETLNRLGLSGFDGVIFGVVALLIPRKGHQVLFDAMLDIIEKINKESKGFKLLIEGDGPLLEKLTTFVNSHGLSECVKFVGNERNVINFISILDVLVLPSIADEDFPNVILEAMAYGKPVIASSIAGITEQVVDGETGLLVQPNNAQQLGNAILKLNHNESLRDKMGQAASLRSQNFFSPDLVVANYMKLYKQLNKD